MKPSKKAKERLRFERFLRKIRRRHLDWHLRWTIAASDYFMLESAKAYYAEIWAEMDSIREELERIRVEFPRKEIPENILPDEQSAP